MFEMLTLEIELHNVLCEFMNQNNSNNIREIFSYSRTLKYLSLIFSLPEDIFTYYTNLAGFISK